MECNGLWSIVLKEMHIVDYYTTRAIGNQVEGANKVTTFMVLLKLTTDDYLHQIACEEWNIKLHALTGMFRFGHMLKLFHYCFVVCFNQD